jgi:penicillin-binding protein-related factor A (putative recombinase)
MGDLTQLGKKAEGKLKSWLDMPEEGFFMLRLPDQLTGFYGSTNMCDFLLYKKPNFYPIESKATYQDRFDFSMISENQHKDLMKASQVDGVTSYVAVLFASYKRLFLLDIRDIVKLEEAGTKSLNIKKIDKWALPYIEVRAILSRKELLDYDKEHALEIFK